VVGFDGTDGALRALDVAVQLVGYGSTITVVSVASGPEDRAGTALADARERLLERFVAASYLLRQGEPAMELVSAAGEVDADLIVVGRRAGRNGANDPGSVSADVVRTASCDVLVVG
jgi:nucleotide-binding universal stress UspA family protein